MLTNMDTTTLIRPDIEHNSKPENQNSQNDYISGDNLDALQHLVKSYSGEHIVFIWSRTYVYISERVFVIKSS